MNLTNNFLQKSIRDDDFLWSKLLQFLSKDASKIVMDRFFKKEFLNSNDIESLLPDNFLKNNNIYRNAYIELINKCMHYKKCFSEAQILTFKKDEQRHVSEVLKTFNSRITEEILDIPLRINEYMQLTTTILPMDVWLNPTKSMSINTSKNTQFDICIQPKYLATGNFTIYPTYLIYDKKFFLKLSSLYTIFTANDIIQKSLTTRPELEPEYIKYMTLFYIKRYLILQLLVCDK